MKWYLNVLDMRGHGGDIEYGDKLSDSDSYGPFDDIDDAIDEWLDKCSELHEDAYYIYPDREIEGECTGGIMDARIVLEFSLYGFYGDTSYKLHGEIFGSSSDGEEIDYDILKSKVYRATNYSPGFDLDDI